MSGLSFSFSFISRVKVVVGFVVAVLRSYVAQAHFRLDFVFSAGVEAAALTDAAYWALDPADCA